MTLPSEALLQPLASGHDTLLATLWHIIGAAETWRVRAETGQDPVEASDFGVLDLAVLAARTRVEVVAMRSFLEALRDPLLAEPMRYTTDRVVRAPALARDRPPGEP
jgi:uncharacterized damage-inducible protein DinB